MKDDIIGHGHIRLRLARLVAGGQFPHACLFYGPTGIGKGMVAMEAARFLLCDSPVILDGAGSACHACHSCHTFVAGNHPDLIVIRSSAYVPETAEEDAPDEDESAPDDAVETQEANAKSKRRGPGTIRIEYIRNLKHRMGFAPMMSSRQVAVILDADLMQGPAANSLLKLLEEPPPGRHLILVTGRPFNLPITIRSRCAKFAFHGLSPDEARAVLSKLTAEGSHDPALVEFYADCFPEAPAHTAKALELPLTRADWDAWLTGNHSIAGAARMAGALAGAKTHLELFLEVLRAVTLKRMKLDSERDASSDLYFLDAITAAKRRLEMHVANAFVLENLLM